MEEVLVKLNSEDDYVINDNSKSHPHYDEIVSIFSSFSHSNICCQ